MADVIKKEEEVKKEEPAVVVPVKKEEPTPDPLAEKDKEIAELMEERDNYKTVALKRLGKLPGDAEFLEGENKTGLTVEEQVRKTLLERAISQKGQERDQLFRDQQKKIAELTLALKNRPQGSTIGGDSSENTEVKDNVFSAQQIAELTARAKRLKADPEKFIENAKRNVLSRR